MQLVPLALWAVLVAAAPPAATVIFDHQPPTHWSSELGGTIDTRLTSSTGRRIFEPALFVRATGSVAYERIPLLPKDDSTFSARIPPDLARQYFEYFLEAFDEDGNGPFRLGSPQAPIRVASIAAVPPPPIELKTGGDAARPRPLRQAGIALLAVGAAGVVAGAVAAGLAVAGHSAESDAVARLDYPAYQSAQSRYHASVLATDVLFATGSALAATGGALLLVSHYRERDLPVQVSLAANSNAAVAVVTGRF